MPPVLCSSLLEAGCSLAAQRVRQVRPALPEMVHFTYGSDVPVNQSSWNSHARPVSDTVSPEWPPTPTEEPPNPVI